MPRQLLCKITKLSKSFIVSLFIYAFFSWCGIFSEFIPKTQYHSWVDWLKFWECCLSFEVLKWKLWICLQNSTSYTRSVLSIAVLFISAVLNFAVHYRMKDCSAIKCSFKYCITLQCFEIQYCVVCCNALYCLLVLQYLNPLTVQ